MKRIKTDQKRSDKIPQSNNRRIFFEIMIVILPLILGQLISGRDVIDFLLPGAALRIPGGPATSLGLVTSLGFLFVATRLREDGWRYFGMTWPKKWFPTILQSLGIALGVFLLLKFIINPMMGILFNASDPDLARFDHLRGNLPNLIVMLVIVWAAGAFLQELLFRGYLMNRLIDLLGKHTKLTRGIALLGQAALFGLLYAYQSPAGMLKAGLIGMVFGFVFLVNGQNLWPLVLAHGLVDTLDMISHFLGG